jgi:hypothetical protein
LATLRDRWIAASEAEIAHSLEGNWRADVLFERQQVMDAYDFHQKQIAACDVQLQRYLAAPVRYGPGVGAPSRADAPSEQSQKRRKYEPPKNQPVFNLV